MTKCYFSALSSDDQKYFTSLFSSFSLKFQFSLPFPTNIVDKRFLYVRLKEVKLFSDSGRESFGGTALKLWGDFGLGVNVMYQIVWEKSKEISLLIFKIFQIKITPVLQLLIFWLTSWWLICLTDKHFEIVFLFLFLLQLFLPFSSGLFLSQVHINQLRWNVFKKKKSVSHPTRLPSSGPVQYAARATTQLTRSPQPSHQQAAS